MSRKRIRVRGELRLCTDVLLQAGSLNVPHGDWPSYLRRRTRLAPDLYIGPREDKGLIFDACMAPGHNTLKPVRQFGSLYAFYRENPPNIESDRYSFDNDNKLATCIQLSRLVRPTTVGMEYAARVFQYRKQRREIVPRRVKGIGAHAYVGDESANWLRNEDIVALRRLLAAFNPAVLPERVKKALWYHEYIAWTYHVDIRWPLAVTALESLIHTDDSARPASQRMRSTDQFVRRLAKLREFVPALIWSDDELETIYDHRSGLVHGVGKGSDALSGSPRVLFMLTEHGLRTILAASILKPAIAEMFRTSTAVRTHLGF